MIRVANVLEDGHLAGPQRRVGLVARGLQAHGIFTVAVLPASSPTATQRYFRELSVPVAKTPMSCLGRGTRRAARWVAGLPSECLRLASLLERHGVQLVHANGVWQPKGLIAARLAGIAGVLHLNDTATTPVFQALHRATRPLASGIAFAGRRVMQVYRQLPWDRALPERVIPAPVDVERFDPEQGDRHPSMIGSEGPHVVMVGHISPDKGTDILLRAAARLSDLRPTPTWHIVGPWLETQPRFAAQIRALADELPRGIVRFHGAQSDVRPFLRGAALYVCASRREASPTAVWEALAMGLPVTSTDVADVAEHLRALDLGVVRPESPDALADLIRTAIARAPGSREDRQSRRRYAVDHFSLDAVVALHAALYRDVLQGG